MPFPLSLFFFRMEAFDRACVLTTSLRTDALVKGILTFLLDVEGDEYNCSFLPFLVVALVEEGTSSNSGAGGVKGLSVENGRPPSLFLQLP
jgi:hypothetical protein